MDQFDSYTSYSDSSAPRTPSPDGIMHPYSHSPANFKQPLDIDPTHNLFPDHSGDENPDAHSQAFWPTPFAQYSSSRGSLLQELYEHDGPHDMYTQEPPSSGHSDWSQMSHEQSIHMQAQHQQQHNGGGQQHGGQQHPQVHMHRRNTFPIVRHDRPESNQQYFSAPFIGSDHAHMLGPYSSRPDTLYGEPMAMSSSSPDPRAHHLPLSADPSALHGGGGGSSRLDEPFIHSMSSSPRGPYRDFDHHHLDAHGNSVKLEDAPVIVPSQTAFYRPPSTGAMHPMAMSYLSPHTGLPVQHTDDAASKETQYLRRRCFNCHTTEPPSWRRSTLNPGKIVCNKCGLYERTHLRPRPLRFDELRAGNKARKQQTKGVAGVVGGGVGSPSPKQKLGGLVKREPKEFGINRRSSVSSTASSVHSGGASSDWDDNGALKVVMYRRRTVD